MLNSFGDIICTSSIGFRPADAFVAIRETIYFYPDERWKGASCFLLNLFAWWQTDWSRSDPSRQDGGGGGSVLFVLFLRRRWSIVTVFFCRSSRACCSVRLASARNRQQQQQQQNIGDGLRRARTKGKTCAGGHAKLLFNWTPTLKHENRAPDTCIGIIPQRVSSVGCKWKKNTRNVSDQMFKTTNDSFPPPLPPVYVYFREKFHIFWV